VFQIEDSVTGAQTDEGEFGKGILAFGNAD
jgi:hypothetical protein